MTLGLNKNSDFTILLLPCILYSFPLIIGLSQGLCNLHTHGQAPAPRLPPSDLQLSSVLPPAHTTAMHFCFALAHSTQDWAFLLDLTQSHIANGWTPLVGFPVLYVLLRVHPLSLY